MNKELIKIEVDFDIFMKSIGYTRVSDDVGASPDFQNADYVCKSKKIVVELKAINKDHFVDGGIIDSLQTIVMQPVNIDEEGLGQYSFSLPNANREGKIDNIEEPLRRIIKKANNQIKETKSYYGFPEGEGYLIIAQIGMPSIGAEVTAALVRKILNHEFKNIDGAIVCSPKGSLIDPFTQEKHSECASITKELDTCKKSRCIDIADNWISFFEKGGHK